SACSGGRWIGHAGTNVCAQQAGPRWSQCSDGGLDHPDDGGVAGRTLMWIALLPVLWHGDAATLDFDDFHGCCKTRHVGDESGCNPLGLLDRSGMMGLNVQEFEGGVTRLGFKMRVQFLADMTECVKRNVQDLMMVAK